MRACHFDASVLVETEGSDARMKLSTDRWTDSLVIANLLARPTRTIGSVMGIGIGVVLIVVTVGLARGMLQSTGEREANLGAELIFQPSGSFGAGVVSAPLALPTAYADAIGELEDVAAVTPVGRYLRSGARGIGYELIEGVLFEPDEDVASYPAIAGITVREGRMPSAAHEIIVDQRRAKDYDAGVGDSVSLLGQEFRITGIFEPEVGARIKMRLDTLQDLLGASNKCSWLLIKTRVPEVQEAVALRIDKRFSGNQIIFTRDIPGFYERGMPSLDVFLDAVVGLATVVSALVILLAMYTSVTERTREIGILKSLGASRRFIVREIQKEALIIAALGLVAGLVLAWLAAVGFTAFSTLEIQLQWPWVLIASAVVLVASLLGALYPAVKAANLDAVSALAYE